MDTYRIESYDVIDGDHPVLQAGDYFQWNNGNETAMLIRRVDGTAQAVLLKKTPEAKWSGEYKDGSEQVPVVLSFNGSSGEISRNHSINDNDTGSFAATQQPG